MRIAITGDRNWSARRTSEIRSALSHLNPATDFVILGDAWGVDTQAHGACHLYSIPHEVHCADWDTHGKAAGPIRNKAMLDSGVDEVWYFHDNVITSRGTKNMCEQARKRGIRVRRGTEVDRTPES